MSDRKPLFDIEITTRCTKHCYCCPRDAFERNDRDMSLATFDTLCDWLPSGSSVFFAGYGEPLLHDQHAQFVEKLVRVGATVSIKTNGIAVTRDKALELFDAGLHKLEISILLRDEESRIEDFLAIIPESKHKNIQFNVIHDADSPRLIPTRNRLAQLGIKAWFASIHSRGGQLYRLTTPAVQKPKCESFLRVTCVRTDGSLPVCPHDINGRFMMGSIETVGFAALAEEKLRRANGGMVAPICAQCDDHFRFVTEEGFRRDGR
ncbi:MAG: radical SAM protein [Polyangiaceae bacterium]|nr:radical SAM protein [Polyangiaceae bacterium]